MVSLALRHANRAVFERSAAERDKMGMGSTASVLVLGDERFIIGHLGDSRIYLFRDGELRQITHDHSVVQEQIDARPSRATQPEPQAEQRDNALRWNGLGRGAGHH